MAARSESNAEITPCCGAAPRLSIRHLMLWTLCCAVYWALIREVNARSTTHMHAGLFSSIVTGAVFAGVITLISMRVRGVPPLLKHPGHWLLLISAIFTLIGTPVIHTVSRSMALENPGPGSWQWDVLIALYLFPPIALVFSACRVRDRSWKVLFVAIFLVDMPNFLYFFGIQLPYFPLGTNVALASVMVVVSIVETKTGPRRDWLHWTGVMTHFASWSANTLSILQR